MLKEITWGQFSVFMLIVIGVYYFYVGLRYFRTELLGWVTRRGGRKSGLGKVHNDNMSRADHRELTEEGLADQAELVELESGKVGNEQFQLVQRAIEVIRQVIAQGGENKLDRENLLDHIREVLGDYRELRKTEYAETINNYLIRVCASELTLELVEKDLAGLWK